MEFTSVLLTWRCKHLFAREDSVCTSHETHRLFRFGQCVSSSCKPNYRRRHDDACCRNCTDEDMDRYRLILELGNELEKNKSLGPHIIFLQRGAGDGHKRVDREGFGVFWHATGIKDLGKYPGKSKIIQCSLGDLVNQPHSIRV